MATWQGLSVAQFLAYGFNADERTSVQNALGGDDSLSDMLTAAIAEWRGVIEAAGYDIDDDTTLLPPSCRRHVVAQVRWQLLIKVSRLSQLQTEERKSAAEVAEEKLQKIEDGDAAVEAPESSTEDQSSAPSFTSPTRDFEWDDEDGL